MRCGRTVSADRSQKPEQQPENQRFFAPGARLDGKAVAHNWSEGWLVDVYRLLRPETTGDAYT
jgi:hypothetical protein